MFVFFFSDKCAYLINEFLKQNSVFRSDFSEAAFERYSLKNINRDKTQREINFSVISKISGRNYGRSSVMTDLISNLTKQSFPEIRRNDQSLNETIWAVKRDKLHVLA